jgi:hypothetical protein
MQPTEERGMLERMDSTASTPRRRAAAAASHVVSLRDVETKLASKMYAGFVGVKDSFRRMDKDFSGMLTYDEFRAALRENQLDVSDEDFKTLCTTFDGNKDGAIDYHEWSERMGGVIHPREGGGMLDILAAARSKEAKPRRYARGMGAPPTTKASSAEVLLADKMATKYKKVQMSE